MNTETKRKNYFSRDAIIKLLSEEEVAGLSTGEAGASLKDGEQYIDLEDMRQGVQVVTTTNIVKMGHVLPRSAVQAETWQRICSHLAEQNQS